MSLSRWWRARRRRLLQLWVGGLLASAFVTGMASLDDVVSVSRVLDILMSLRQPPRPSDVVIVTLDDPAFGERGRQGLPRDDLARILRGLHRADATAVGLAVSLREPGDATADAALARAIAEFAENGRHRLVVADTVLPERGPLADPAVTRLLTLATLDLPEDRDGVVRRVESRGARDLPFAVGLASAASIPGPWAGLRINYVGPAGSFPTIPADAVGAPPTSALDGSRAPSLRGKIVLIGRAVRDGQDVRNTPYGGLSDLEIQANIVHMLLTHTFVRPAGWLVGSVLDLLAILVAGVVMVAVRPLWGTLWCTAGALTVGMGGSYVAFSRDGYWVDFLLPVAAVALLGIGTNAMAHRRLRVAFGRYVSPQVAARIERNSAELAGELRQVSILFSDIRGFTTLSEQCAPEQMARRLTEYFEAMAAVISAHQGMVNDFVGDGILAVFGAPLDDPDHARHAVESACAMQQALEQLNQHWQTAGLAPLRIGIGIHTGEVFAGNVGGAGKVKYAVVGDTVNLAARVEGLNKELGTTMLITEATHYASGLELRISDRGLIDLKGRHDPVRIYEVPAPSLEEATR